MKLRMLFVVCCVLCASGAAFAQSIGSKPVSKQTNLFISPKEELPGMLQDGQDNPLANVRGGFKEVNEWVTKAADMVPAEKYDYRPTDTVRTYGQLIGHITDSYNFFCARGAGKKVEWADPAEKGTTDKATLLPKLKQAVEACNAAYDSANGQFRPLLMNVAHTNLHYGNIITYMRMMGMKPPSS